MSKIKRKQKVEIQGIRTRFSVIFDRAHAGVPFYYHATTADERIALASPERKFLGLPVEIVDQDDDHYVLQCIVAA